jgi:hypothetical protein
MVEIRTMPLIAGTMVSTLLQEPARISELETSSKKVSITAEVLFDRTWGSAI